MQQKEKVNIYYKEGSHCRSKKEYIDTYLNLDCPSTFYLKTDELQCRRGYARSSNDLFCLLKSRFKSTTVAEFTRIIFENPRIQGVVCTDVKDFTFWNKEFSGIHNRQDYFDVKNDKSFFMINERKEMYNFLILSKINNKIVLNILKK